MDAFFQLHRDLPREGPGHRDDLDRALGLVSLPPDARILDAGCGPGADVAGLLAHCPDGRVIAVDAHEPFVAQVGERYRDDPRVEPRVGDMAAVEGRFDLVWCAGALYFLGLEPGLATLRDKLRPGGVLAFSHPCWFVDAPSEAARAFWDGEDALVLDAAGIRDVVRDAGLDVVRAFPLSDAAWEAYYGPLDARVVALTPGADPALREVLEQSLAESAGWRAVRRETGYLQVVARLAV